MYEYKIKLIFRIILLITIVSAAVILVITIYPSLTGYEKHVHDVPGDEDFKKFMDIVKRIGETIELEEFGGSRELKILFRRENHTFILVVGKEMTCGFRGIYGLLYYTNSTLDVEDFDRLRHEKKLVEVAWYRLGNWGESTIIVGDMGEVYDRELLSLFLQVYREKEYRCIGVYGINSTTMYGFNPFSTHLL